MKQIQTFFPRTQGQSLVEIALVLPVLLILFLGIAEVGFLLYAHVQVANATREGARYGSLCRLNDNCDGGSSYSNLSEVVESAVFSEAQTLKMNSTNTLVTVQPPSLSSLPTVGTPITVTVSYSHTLPFVSSIVPMFPAETSIQHTNVMRFDR
jgi:Flp pilus assembly protein TadG